jgi:putative two-component system response regulator
MRNQPNVTTAQSDPATRRRTQHIVYDLAHIIRVRDIITYEHCRRVALYVNRLARAMGWSRRAARDLALAGLVHDLGKIWMQNTVLHKSSALSGDERAEMERHPVIAANILSAYGAPLQLVEVVKHHHEAYDGRGYPDHLAGNAIPLGARLLTVADVFDVLTSDRPYKAASDLATARARLASGVGTYFDPRVADAFFALLDCTPDFLLPPRVSPLPVRMAASPSWTRHDTFEE